MSVKVVESEVFESAEQRMKVQLLLLAGNAKPWRVRAEVREGTKLVEGGFLGVDRNEAEIRKLYAWAKEQARSKGWQPTHRRGGGHVRMLQGVPAPKPARVTGRPAKHV